MKLDRSGKKKNSSSFIIILSLFIIYHYHYLLLMSCPIFFLFVEVFPFILRLYFEKRNKLLQLNGLNVSFRRSKYY